MNRNVDTSQAYTPSKLDGGDILRAGDSSAHAHCADNNDACGKNRADNNLTD
jgi:hypothetical protein